MIDNNDGEKNEVIILYDGVCLFCEGWVNFVIDHLADNVNVQFIPLQYVTLKLEIQHKMNQLNDSDSIICITSGNQFLLKSDASLTMMSYLRSPYNFLAKLLLIIPSEIRDFVYDLVGKRRYKIWGKKDYCITPTGDRKKFFIHNKEEISVQLQYQNYFSFSDSTQR